jgi:hypothetical protein
MQQTLSQITNSVRLNFILVSLREFVVKGLRPVNVYF